MHIPDVAETEGRLRASREKVSVPAHWRAATCPGIDLRQRHRHLRLVRRRTATGTATLTTDCTSRPPVSRWCTSCCQRCSTLAIRTSGASGPLLPLALGLMLLHHVKACCLASLQLRRAATAATPGLQGLTVHDSTDVSIYCHAMETRRLMSGTSSRITLVGCCRAEAMRTDWPMHAEVDWGDLSGTIERWPQMGSIAR